ncbi:hypothetical protein [Halorubellus litoreus]|uniref:Uncharacterized protein n=1 Tax=Halorubellus litoreus TaxID=755308 RepID=A0ABD5VCB9_9EURY
MITQASVAVGDFVRADADASIPEGIYRIVGRPQNELVCLRVTDDAGERASTGELVRVDPDDYAHLEPATEPMMSALTIMKGLLEGPYWIVRSLLPF